MYIFDQDHRAKKQYFAGTHRSRSPEQTVLECSRWFKKMGITRVANVTGLDDVGIPVTMAIRPNSRSLSVSQGKGQDVLAATASALMETIEFWHAERIHNPLRYESYGALRAEAAVVDVEELPSQRGRSVANDVPMLWIEGYDILRQERIWLPFELVNMNTVLPAGTTLTFSVNTNGLASGNHILEATLHALLELIERDALALWGLRDDPAAASTSIDLSRIDDADCRSIISKFGDAGLELVVWDVTTDLGIPAFHCAVADRSDRVAWRPFGIYHGSGCHLAADVALSRALTEAAQARLTMIAGSRDDNPHAVYSAENDAARLSELRRQYFAIPGERSFQALNLATDSFEEDLQLLLRRLQAGGLDRVIVVDLSKPDIGIPVVKVVVPGLAVALHPPHEPHYGRRRRPM